MPVGVRPAPALIVNPPSLISCNPPPWPLSHLSASPPLPQTAPEIQRTALVSAVLYLKSLPLNIDVLGFDYLDAPAVSGAYF